jgi:hypothetical protein
MDPASLVVTLTRHEGDSMMKSELSSGRKDYNLSPVTSHRAGTSPPLSEGAGEASVDENRSWTRPVTVSRRLMPH